MPLKKMKLADVAAEAHVSLATASLVLTGKGRISREVRERVLAASESLGYRRRALQPLHAVQAVSRIGILHHQDKEYEWNFIRPFLFQIESTLLHHALLPVLVPVTLGTDVEELYKRVTDTGVGALFAIHYHDEELFSRLEKRGIRVVLVNNSNLQDKFSSVCVDDFQGAYEGSLYLVRLGHRNILYVDYSRPDLPAVVSDRFVGFRKALDEHGIPFSADQRITAEPLDTGGIAAKLRGPFGRQKRPTAVFAHDDYVAAYVLEALRSLGLTVPEDVSLVAPGDVLDYSQPYVPQITTMRINTEIMGKLACQLLLDLLRDDTREVHGLKVKQRLVKRASCRRIR